MRLVYYNSDDSTKQTVCGHVCVSVVMSLCVCLSVVMSVCVCLSVVMSVCVCLSVVMYVCVCLSVVMSVCVCLSVCGHVCLCLCVCGHVCVCLSVCCTIDVVEVDELWCDFNTVVQMRLQSARTQQLTRHAGHVDADHSK